MHTVWSACLGSACVSSSFPPMGWALSEGADGAAGRAIDPLRPLVSGKACLPHPWLGNPQSSWRQGQKHLRGPGLSVCSRSQTGLFLAGLLGGCGFLEFLINSSLTESMGDPGQPHWGTLSLALHPTNATPHIPYTTHTAHHMHTYHTTYINIAPHTPHTTCAHTTPHTQTPLHTHVLTPHRIHTYTHHIYTPHPTPPAQTPHPKGHTTHTSIKLHTKHYMHKQCTTHPIPRAQTLQHTQHTMCTYYTPHAQTPHHIHTLHATLYTPTYHITRIHATHTHTHSPSASNAYCTSPTPAVHPLFSYWLPDPSHQRDS